MSGALSQVWGMINGLQIFVHLPLFDISMPANAGVFIGKIAEVATFDVVENKDVFDGWLLTIPETNEGELNGRFVESGYEHRDMVQLLGVGFIVIFVTLIIMLILCLTNPLRRLGNKIEKVHAKVSNIIFWNFWLRFLIEDSLVAEISVCCYFFNSNVETTETSSLEDVLPRDIESQPSYDSTYQQVNTFLASSMGMVLFVLPFFVVAFYSYHHEKLAEKKFKSTVGECYAGMKKESKSIIFYSFFFLARRWVLVAILCWSFFSKQVVVQLHTTLVLTMVEIVYLTLWMPFKLKLVNRLELFNEYTAMVLLYHVFFFTRAVSDVQV